MGMWGGDRLGKVHWSLGARAGSGGIANVPELHCPIAHFVMVGFSGALQQPLGHVAIEPLKCSQCD